MTRKSKDFSHEATQKSYVIQNSNLYIFSSITLNSLQWLNPVMHGRFYQTKTKNALRDEW